jgi:predicted DNA-binding transcriptional regulator AlpA
MLLPDNLSLPESLIDNLADALWARMVGSNCDPVELNLRAKLALEHRLVGGNPPSFGLDKLGTDETAAYSGVKAETLRDKTKRRILGFPLPYKYGRKLFWRRSELDQWIERRRVQQFHHDDTPLRERASRVKAIKPGYSNVEEK